MKHSIHSNPSVTKKGYEHIEVVSHDSYFPPESLCIFKTASIAGLQSFIISRGGFLSWYVFSVYSLPNWDALLVTKLYRYSKVARSRLDSAHVQLVDDHAIGTTLKVSCAALSCLQSPSFSPH